MTKLQMRWAAISFLMLLSALFITGGCRGNSLGNEPVTDTVLEDLPTEFQRIEEVWKLLQLEHIHGGNLDTQELSDGAIRGMLQALDDPYAAFLAPGQYALESQDIQGFFGGIGAEVGIRNGHITILAPMPDSPAEDAGIQPGDKILAIDGESTQGISLLEAVGKIRGEKGTAVQLLISHLNGGKPELVIIDRDIILLESVRLLMHVGRIGHLRLFSFTGTTTDELMRAFERFERSQGLGLVLDLRNNPGGLLSAVVDVTSKFIDDGLVLYQVDAHGNRTDWNVKKGTKIKGTPMVVLVNEFSASASEVFIGAIMHHGRAPVIGTTTYGKGSVNNLWPLTDGSGVNFTVAQWFTPGGIQIEGHGIEPDIVQDMSGDDTEDVQLDLAIQILQEQIAQVD